MAGKIDTDYTAIILLYSGGYHGEKWGSSLISAWDRRREIDWKDTEWFTVNVFFKYALTCTKFLKKRTHYKS